MARKRAGEAGAATRERLTPEAIVSRAIALADAEGLDAVTIRRLAQDQGVTPMALYWHFRDKELLLDGVVERMLSEVELPPPAEVGAQVPWDERLRGLLGPLLAMLRAHPALADLVQDRFLGSPSGLELSERVFELLYEAGFSRRQVSYIGIFVLQGLVRMVADEPGRPVGGEDDEATQTRLRVKKAAFQTLSPQKFPNVLRCSDSMTVRPDETEYFGFGLDLILAGIRAMRPTSA